jgi:glycosyltransferase involved in cell wall biosynthesis
MANTIPIKQKIEELSIFFPAYNEEANIVNTVKKASDVARKIANRYEIIVINDGSTDSTASKVEKLFSYDQNIRLINHEINEGYGSSIISGLYGSKYENIVFTDSDGQFDFSEINNFIDSQRNSQADLIIGYYKKRNVPLQRKINTFLWQKIIRLFFGLKVKDIDCGFKLLKRKVVQKIPKLKSQRGAFISSELLIKAQKVGFKICEIPVNHYPRKSGKPTGANISVILNSFKDLFSIILKGAD